MLGGEVACPAVHVSRGGADSHQEARAHVNHSAWLCPSSEIIEGEKDVNNKKNFVGKVCF